MHIISRTGLLKDCRKNRYVEAAQDLDTWERSARRANWANLADVRKTYPKADGVTIGKRTYTVFNILGNRFRLIVQIVYDSRTIFFKRILTHAEYDRDNWKQNLFAGAGGTKEMSAIPFNQAVYGRLLANVLPHVIHTDAENERSIAKLETLSNRGNLSTEEKELADLLTVLIEKYEERYQIEPASTPAERVRHFMDAQDLKPADMLDIFGTKSVVSEVLSGKRELSKAHIRALSKRFHVSPEIFFS